MQLSSLTNGELSNYAEGIADTELEKELLRRFDVLLDRLSLYETGCAPLLSADSLNMKD